MYIKAKVLFKFGSLERLYVKMKLLYNLKIWWKLNLVPNVGFRNISGFLIYFCLAERYIYTHERNFGKIKFGDRLVDQPNRKI